MESIYFLILIALIGLAFADLIVGVSNDAVNFLNSAIGSKVLSFKTIMIVQLPIVPFHGNILYLKKIYQMVLKNQYVKI